MLPLCIKAAKEQRGGFDYEIIIVDNNSTDKTYKLAKSLGVVVVKEERRGVGQARKTGTELARGKFVLHIDADSRLPDDYLLSVQERFHNNPKLSCLGGQMVYYDAPWWKNFLRFFIHYILWLVSVVLSLGRIGPMGNNMVFRKSDYDKTKGFDPSLRFGEDANLARQLSRLGKVRLDMSLKCPISVRRFGLNWKLAIQFVNLLAISAIGKPLINDLPSH